MTGKLTIYEDLGRDGYIKVAKDIDSLPEAPRIAVSDIQLISEADPVITQEGLHDMSASIQKAAAGISITLTVTAKNLLRALGSICETLAIARQRIQLEKAGYRIVNHHGRNKLVSINKKGGG